VNATFGHLTAGASLVPGRAGYDEAPSVSFARNGPIVRLVIEGPEPRLVETVAGEGAISFAWLGHDDAALLCLSVSDSSGQTVMPWLDIPYHLGNDIDGVAEPGFADPAGGPAPATVVVIDAASGRIAARRDCQWPAEAIDAIRATLRRQHAKGFNAGAKSRRLTAIRSRYVDPHQMAARGADVVWTAEPRDQRP
jgi:hypothetical protein